MTTITAVGSATAEVPWNCWYGDTRLPLAFPEGFRVDVLKMRDAAAMSPEAVAAAVQNPVGPSLRELAGAARSAVIAVDDISRPTPAELVLPAVLGELSDIADAQVRIVVALGAHRPLVRQELQWKLGAAVLERYSVEQHHPYENLVDLGRSTRGTPIRLNRTFCEADLKIAIGGVMPHPYMGFGGGAKIVLPGLAGIETLQANHQPAVSGISGGLCNPDVDARRDIEEIALGAGLAFSCNAVVGASRQLAGLFCGHPVAAHRAAVAFARQTYATPLPAEPYDILCLNAYPKDTELLQVGNALNCYRTAATPPVRPGGTVVITACCATGRGYHSLHGKDMRLYRTPGQKPFLDGREIVVFSPNLNARDFEVSFWSQYRFFTSWPLLAEYLERKHGGPASVGVVPLAPLQIFE